MDLQQIRGVEGAALIQIGEQQQDIHRQAGQQPQEQGSGVRRASAKLEKDRHLRRLPVRKEVLLIPVQPAQQVHRPAGELGDAAAAPLPLLQHQIDESSGHQALELHIGRIPDVGGETRRQLLCGGVVAPLHRGDLLRPGGRGVSVDHADPAAAALEGSLSCIRWDCWARVVLGLLVSVGAGFWAGRRALRALSRLSWSDRLFRRAQIPGAALTAFLHGAQDGQKFLGILLLGIALSQGRQDEQTFLIPFWLMALCAGSMALGTGMGGRRIIDTVGREMVRLGPREGLASDLGGGGCLLLSTLLGLPVSTTHTRTAALLGAGSTSGRRIDWSVARSIALTWVLTFPGCFTLGWCMARLFLAWV